MLPVLFRIVIPASLAKPLVVVLAVGIAAVRAFLMRRRAAADGQPLSFWKALWEDKVTVAILAVLAAVLWRAGYLDEELRIPLHTYGLLLALGFVIAIYMAQREAKRQGQDAEAIGDLSFWILVAALVGSRVYYIFVNWDEYFGANAMVATRIGRIPRLLAVWEGGLVFYGGFIASVLTAWWYMRRRNMHFLTYADTMIPSVALGHFFGRLGCFSAGCCWGQVSHAHLPWLAEFPPESLAYQSFAARADPSQYLAPDRLHTLPLHPTQLYEAGGELLLFLLLVTVVRPRKRFHGQVLAIWLMAYAVLRYVVESFRGDVERGVVAGLGVGAWTSIAIFAVGAAIFAAGWRRATAAAVA